jgi:trigger factor
MVSSKTVTPLEHSKVKLDVSVEKDALRNEYTSLLSKYGKEAHIKGFRKGMVPLSVLEMKFGDAIKQEASFNLLEKSLAEVFETIEEKPLPYSTPSLESEESFKPEFDAEFNFSVTYDIFPKVALGIYSGLTVEEPEVALTDEDEKRELEALREQNALVVEKKDAKVAKDDIVTMNYAELDEAGNEKPGTARQDFVFTVGTGYNIFKLDDDVIGMAKDEERVIEKDYPADYEIKEYAGKKVRVKVKITAVKTKQLPELDDDLAQDISEEYKTLDDLKAAIRKRLETVRDNYIRTSKMQSLLDQIIANSPIDLPVSMVNAELERSWMRFVRNTRMQEEQVLKLLSLQNKTREALSEEWKPEAEKSLKSSLLVDKMLEAEKIEVSDSEVEEALKKEAEESKQSFDELKKYYEDNHILDMVKSELKERKLFDKLLADSKIVKGKEVKLVDVLSKNQ